ncbi:alpha/beta hydrolase [Christiangramia fulva]|uniref:Alpha/beta hydrolase n=1 Tax=Christiangramia fulva TaxID=2126553 RepID=A0A2R3Z343_9FLAO|nr:alpha/beta fold hydrolase [Christiangramia fulva]AVR44659.1 alpha/beta hydrolase [Christiangramia fulva]
MPLLSSNYIPPRLYRNADIATIYAATLRKVAIDIPERERLELKDGDFIDLDWFYSGQNSRKAIILLHGLAGNSTRPYMKGMAKVFNKKGWDAISVNLRGCSGEMNRLYRSYHAGVTNDLGEIINHILSLSKYEKIVLLGFSLGGNIVLKYLAERDKIPSEIVSGIGISVPCDLAGSLGAINKMRNFVYAQRFLVNLKEQLLQRAEKFPEKVNPVAIKKCRSLRDIDDLYTSKAHGYKNASDYYRQASSLYSLEKIKIPSLLINAKNDSFLSEESYPYKKAEHSPYFHLETPVYGGHVGFITKNGPFYHEKRAIEFAKKQLGLHPS